MKKEKKEKDVTLAEAKAALRRLRTNAKNSGLDKMTMAEINREIEATRAEMRADGFRKLTRVEPPRLKRESQ